MATAKARKFRELRKAQGWSTDELGRRLGVDEATVRRWEDGEEEPDADALDRLATTYGVSQDELRHEEDRRHHPASKT